jgi:hypothetical protein
MGHYYKGSVHIRGMAEKKQDICHIRADISRKTQPRGYPEAAGGVMLDGFRKLEIPINQSLARAGSLSP